MVNPVEVVPFYVGSGVVGADPGGHRVLGLLVANMRLAKKDNLRFALATALSRFTH